MFQAIEKKHGLPAGLRRILYIFCVLAILGDTMWSDGITLCERTRIVSWEAPYAPEESETAGRLLYLWRATDKEKLFYFPQE